MSQNILITGAAGYIGGSVLTDILSRTDETLKAVKLFATVRGQDQVDQISKLERVQVVQVDVNDKAAVEEIITQNKIDVVVHTAGSMFPVMVSNLLSALGERRRISARYRLTAGKSSVATMFTEEGGWPFGEVKDTDSIIDKEREIGVDNPVRRTNLVLADEGKAQGVETFNLAVPMIYGRGTGECRKLSVNLPALIRTSIKLKKVHKFDTDASPWTAHISDLTTYYVLLLSKILKREPLSFGNDRYFFPIAHRAPWWAVMDKIAKALYARGLINDPTPQIWENNDIAADSLGFPRLYIKGIGMSNGDLIPVNAQELGWSPAWNEEKFLDSMDDEIRDVQELDTVKMSLFDSLVSKQDQ
ncbi:hypothetical protein FSARC_1069 [Fusarium sarcochroum]|uniref:NAD-dependent epimerase/dehydratase domain-containing protein n=1 Tax=Fusarium sarcochroum TaxID=1208366 RepID=A0A8H4XEP1_9HYPO|nr:hypothetical protein FSARC_1069 [Fusarium sarcochroum]